MKHHRTMTLFVCAIISILIALFITSFKELYDSMTNTDNSDVNIISLEDSNANIPLTNIVLTRDHDFEMYETIEIFIEERDDIKLENENCFGFSPYKVSDITHSIEQNTLSLKMQRNDKANEDNVCSDIKLYLPSTIERIDLSAITSSQLNIFSEHVPANLTINTSADYFAVTGQYHHLALWQFLLASEDFGAYPRKSITLSQATIDTLDIYSNNFRLTIEDEVTLGNGRIHTRAMGSLTLYDYSLLNKVEYLPLSTEEKKRLSLVSESTN